MTLPKVLFFRVKDNQAKFRAICHRVQEELKKERRLLIIAPNEEAANFIDGLLWRLPEESFIPHAIIQKPSQEWVAITTSKGQNLNSAPCLFNLCPRISPIYQQFEEIYELYDETHPQKAQSSQMKLKDYQAKGLTVNEIPFS